MKVGIGFHLAMTIGTYRKFRTGPHKTRRTMFFSAAHDASHARSFQSLGKEIILKSV